MTKAKALRNYFKKFYNVDTNGMSAVEVYRDFAKKKYNFDSKASGFVTAVNEMVSNDLTPGESGGGGGGDNPYVEIVDVLPPIAEADPNKIYLRRNMVKIQDSGYSWYNTYFVYSDEYPEDYDRSSYGRFSVYSTATEKGYHWDTENDPYYAEDYYSNPTITPCLVAFTIVENDMGDKGFDYSHGKAIEELNS